MRTSSQKDAHVASSQPISRGVRSEVKGRRERAIRLLATVAVLASAFTGFGATAARAAGTGGDLKIAMSAGNVPIPDASCDQGGEGIRFVCDNLYDQLFHYNLDQATSLPTPHPDLATRYTLSPDRLTWTFYLRHGVRFTDGTPFNADAVIFNWERDTNTKFKYYDAIDAGRLAQYTVHWKTFKKVNEYEVTLSTFAPYSFELWDQASIFYASPTAVKKWGNANYPQHATGTGPFVMTKYTNNVTMVMKPNKQYWAGPPKLDEIQLFPQPEDASRLASLESGSVNWAEVPSPDALSQLKGQGFQIFMQDQHPGAIMPMYNELRPPFNNVLVRKALNYAVNRNATVAVINGTGLPASQWVPKGNPYYIPNYSGYNYNPQKAKALLAKADYGPGKKHLTISMAYTPNGSGNMFPEPMMEQLQSSFKAVGVTLNITPIEWDTFLTIRTSGGAHNPEYAKYNMFWQSPGAGSSPTQFETSFLCSNNGIKNYVGYCDPKVDHLFDRAEDTFNTNRQNSILQQMERVAENDAPILYWVTDKNLRVMSPKVHGYVQAWSWYVDFTKMWVS